MYGGAAAFWEPVLPEFFLALPEFRWPDKYDAGGLDLLTLHFTLYTLYAVD